MPAVFKQMIKRMVRWHVLPPTCVPNSCIVNIYEEGDCIPPHIDHHDFVRPFCTVSFLSECNILFGSSLKIVSPGEFSGPVSVPLPKGSVLVLQGNGADVAKHCVPGVPSKRISVTFRKMDESKSPFNYKPDPELLRIQPLVLPRPLVREPSTQQSVAENEKKMKHDKPHSPPAQTTNQNVLAANKEFSPLGSFSSSSKNRSIRRVKY
nr:RNA demethylase ALKBH5-like [Ipomoea batatas]